MTKAIVLVAGKGSRLQPLTKTMPKCLTEVNGKAILENALNILSQCDVRATSLVIGYLGSQIKERFGKSMGAMRIEYIENVRYAETNTSYSLWLAVKQLEDESDLLVLEGDVFFDAEVIKETLRSPFPSLSVVDQYRPGLDGSFVDVDNGVIRDWVHKSQREPDFDIKTKHKTVNIHKFSNAFVENNLKPVLEQQVAEYEGNAPMEYVMRQLVTNGAVVHAHQVESGRWYEIDTTEELAVAESIFRDNSPKNE